MFSEVAFAGESDGATCMFAHEEDNTHFSRKGWESRLCGAAPTHEYNGRADYGVLHPVTWDTGMLPPHYEGERTMVCRTLDLMGGSAVQESTGPSMLVVVVWCLYRACMYKHASVPIWLCEAHFALVFIWPFQVVNCHKVFFDQKGSSGHNSVL